MQTFLPYEDFYLSAKVLDKSRIGNQFWREGKTLIHGGWKNHPASKMWKGYGFYFCEYLFSLYLELIYRKPEKEILYSKHLVWLHANWEYYKDIGETEKPWWLGDKSFHDSHKSNLIRKYPEHYRKFWPDVPDNLDYIWPV